MSDFMLEMFTRKSKITSPPIGEWNDYEIRSHPQFLMIQECPHPLCWNFWNQSLLVACAYCGTLIERSDTSTTWKYNYLEGCLCWS